MLGIHEGRAIYLLYNGILKDKSLGGGTLEGDMAYGAVDLGLSVYGVGRMVLTALRLPA